MMESGKIAKRMEKVSRVLSIGTYYCATNEKYVGEWKDGKANGKGSPYATLGIFYYANNERYEGEWKDNNMCGNGRFTQHN